MASDIKEINRQTGDVKKARRFDDRDWKWIADYIVAELQRRQQARSDTEKCWKEIDRQVAMEPEVAFKKLPDGKVDITKKWMAETELPLQAQALEVLTSDSRRMMFTDSGDWFAAHAMVTDKTLQDIEENIRIYGDEHYIASKINQDNVDKIVHGFLLHNFRQYDHTSRFDIINAEAFKYGTGVGRGRLERKNVFFNEARGVRKETHRLPVIVPCSIKNIYLEEMKSSVHSSTVLGAAHIAHDNLKYENVAIAASKGSTDPDDDDGGWMPKNFAKIVPGKGGYVQLLEMEGDIVVPRRTVRSFHIPNAIITVAIGGEEGGRTTLGVIRFRYRKSTRSSYLLFPYMQESADDTYASGPLMKGRTVQMAATDATNRFLDSAMLKNSPPVGYDRNDQNFANNGGPAIYPNAQWGTTDPVKVYTEIGGDPSALASATMQFINLYAELTGVLPARVGSATKSHTTATAKDVELQRGSARTVDYVNAIGHGPLTSWLYMAYDLARDGLKGKLPVYIESYGGWVEIDKKMLPDAAFEWFGSGGPQEKQQKSAQKMNAALNALKIDQMRMQMGLPPRINSETLIDQVLREGGWNDISALVNADGNVSRSAPAPGIPGAANGAGGSPAAALQQGAGARG